MNARTAHTPRVLIIHDGSSVAAYLAFLRAAGLEASETAADHALAQALVMEPDIIVLDFDCDGEIMAALHGDARTSTIPVIALADLPHRNSTKALLQPGTEGS